jgi:hypothetical protein
MQHDGNASRHGSFCWIYVISAIFGSRYGLSQPEAPAQRTAQLCVWRSSGRAAERSNACIQELESSVTR